MMVSNPTMIINTRTLKSNCLLFMIVELRVVIFSSHTAYF
jgi:hypothetical protein